MRVSFDPGHNNTIQVFSDITLTIIMKTGIILASVIVLVFSENVNSQEHPAKLLLQSLGKNGFLQLTNFIS